METIHRYLGQLLEFLRSFTPRWLSGKNPPANAGDMGSIPGWGRSPGEGNGNPLQYYCLENPTDRGTTWATRGHKTWGWLSNWEHSTRSFTASVLQNWFSTTTGNLPIAPSPLWNCYTSVSWTYFQISRLSSSSFCCCFMSLK